MLQQAELGGCKQSATGCAIDMCTDILNLPEHVGYVGTVVSAAEGAGLRRGMLKVLEILLIHDLGLNLKLS